MPSIPMLLFLTANIALPNMFLKAEYNFPLLLLACLMWPKQELRQTIVYLILLSWMADMYFILRYINQDGEKEEKSEMVLVLSIVLLVSKVLLVVWIIVSDEKLRRRLTCMGVMKSLASVGNTRDYKEDYKEDQT